MFEHDPHANTELIVSMLRSTDIPIQLLSSLPDAELCSYWLEQGMYRVIINEVMLTDPDGVKALIKQYTPSKLWVQFEFHRKE
jgi:phosphoribosylformimino-5-aminoimidazole carboxamide ribonucleotide (ProFAR) isomerase